MCPATSGEEIGSKITGQRGDGVGAEGGTESENGRRGSREVKTNRDKTGKSPISFTCPWGWNTRRGGGKERRKQSANGPSERGTQGSVLRAKRA